MRRPSPALRATSPDESGEVSDQRSPDVSGELLHPGPRALGRHDRRELRFFALGLALVIVVVFWWLMPWLRDRTAPLWPLIVAWVLVVTAWLHPPAILPIHRAFLPVARVLGWLNTWLLLGTVFFAILLPVGWVLRRLGKLQYVTGFDAAVDTYRVPVPPEHRLRLEDPF
jgi:hypothetical protein